MNSQNFENHLRWSGLSWIAQCGALAAVTVAGLASGQLVLFSVAAILIFVLLNGVWPYWQLHRELEIETAQDAYVDEGLSTWSRDDAAAVLNEEPHSTLHYLVIQKGQHADRDGGDEIDEALLNVVRERFDEHVMKIGDTAEQAPLLALGGSMLGLAVACSSIGDSAGSSAMREGLVAMSATSVVGLFAAMALLGLESRSVRAIDAYINSLRARLAGAAVRPAEIRTNGLLADSLFRREP